MIRRISRAKWEEIEQGEVSADAITNDLKTVQNDLSVWVIPNKKELEKAVLALITGAKQTKFSTLHLVLIEENLVISKSLILKITKGDTVIKSLQSLHRDIGDLTYSKLGTIKDLILNCIKSDNYALYTKRQLKDLVKSAIASGELLKESLNPELVSNEKI